MPAATRRRAEGAAVATPTRAVAPAPRPAVANVAPVGMGGSALAEEAMPTSTDVLNVLGRMVTAAAERRMAQGRPPATHSYTPAPPVRTMPTVQPARASATGGAVRTCHMCSTGMALCALPGCPMPEGAP